MDNAALASGDMNVVKRKESMDGFGFRKGSMEARVNAA